VSSSSPEQDKVTGHVRTILINAGEKGATAKKVLSRAIEYKVVPDNSRGSRARIIGALRVLKTRGIAVRAMFPNDEVVWYMKDKCPEKVLAMITTPASTTSDKPSEEWIISTAERIATGLLIKKGYFTFLQFQAEMADDEKEFPYGHLKKACMRGIQSLFTKGLIKKENKRYVAVDQGALSTQNDEASASKKKPAVQQAAVEGEKQNDGTITLHNVVEIRFPTVGGAVIYQLDPKGQTVNVNVDGQTLADVRSIRYESETPIDVTILFLSGRTMKLSEVKKALVY
jgi:hypothetical protein